MDIIIKKEVPQSFELKVTHLDPKTGKTKSHKKIVERDPATGNTKIKKAKRGEKASGKVEVVSKTVTIPDELLPKVIAVIDEVFDRSLDEMENLTTNTLGFPLVPFPFFEKYREPDRYGIDDYWNEVWLNTALREVIAERAKIIGLLYELEALYLEEDPVVSLRKGMFKGDRYILVLERDKLSGIKKEIINHQEAQKVLNEIFGPEGSIGDRKSVYFNKVKTVNDLLQNLALRDKCLGVLGDDLRSLTRGKWYKTSTDEANDEVVALMENIGLVQADWNGFREQTHKAVGHRTIEFSYDIDHILDLLDRVEGKNAILKKQTLEFISRHLGDQGSGVQLVELLRSWGVPDGLIVYPNTKWRMICSILTYYASSPNEQDHQMLFKLIEEATHPLMYSGDKERALEVQDSFSTYLQYDGYCFENGKVVKVTDDFIQNIDERQKKRKEQADRALAGFPDLGTLLFGSVAPPQPKPVEPTEIRIVGMPDIKLQGLEEKVVLQKPRNKKVQLRQFPPDTRWEDISIQFLNDHEVIIKAKNETRQTTYELMGFQDEKRKLPNQQWTFLRVLASKDGELSWENNSSLTTKQISSVKKRKQLLADTLKAYFQIGDDPFHSYRTEKAYKIKIRLIPETGSTSGLREEEIYQDDFGIGEHLRDQAPEVYDG